MEILGSRTSIFFLCHAPQRLKAIPCWPNGPTLLRKVVHSPWIYTTLARIASYEPKGRILRRDGPKGQQEKTRHLRRKLSISFLTTHSSLALRTSSYRRAHPAQTGTCECATPSPQSGPGFRPAPPSIRGFPPPGDAPCYRAHCSAVLPSQP